MSIIFNVAARKEESFIVMAAGSDPESNEEPVATGDANSYHQTATTATTNTSAHHNHHHHHHTHHSHYLGLPYQDHNYGAPPPPTPPQSPPHHPIVNGFTDELSNHSNQSNNTETADENEESSITRCICGFDHDDGYMICCDQCCVWQHVECMGLDRNNMPDSYYCETCAPRKVEKQKAVALQSKKKEQMTGIDTSATDSGDEVTTTRYTAVSNSPTSLTLTTLKSKKVKRKKKKREKDEEKEDKQQDKETKKPKIKRDGGRKLKTTEFVPLNEETMDSWDIEGVISGELMKNYEEASVNQYSADIQHILASHKQNSTDAVIIPNKKLLVQLNIFGLMNKNIKGLQATEDIKKGQPLLEYVSKVMLKEQFDAQDPFFKRPYPFVVFYNKFDNVEMCLDARSYGNDARFVRKSCSPNAELCHAVKDGNIHLYISSLTEIIKGCEISIAFDFNFKDCAYRVDCACLTENCPVAKHNSNCFENGTHDVKKKKNHHKNNHILRGEEDVSQSSHAAGPASSKSRKISPLRVSLGNHDNQNNQEPVPEPIETLENDDSLLTEQQSEATKEQQVPETEPEHEQKKMTREERKMQAIMEAFKRMEKTEKRRQQALERIAQAKAKTETEKAVTETKEEENKDVDPTVTVSEVEDKLSTPQLPKPRPIKRNNRRRSTTSKRRRANSTASVVTPTPSLDQSSPETSMCSTPVTPAPPSAFSDNSMPSLASPTSSSKTFRFPKTKKFLINEWLNEKAQESSANKPLTIKTEPVDLNVPTSCPGTPVWRTAIGNNLDKSLDASMGSAKKRWLRQAMSETGSNSPNKTVADCVSPVCCNGTLSPTATTSNPAHSPAMSPNGSSVVDFMTPLKKRRLRASIAAEETVTTTVISAPPTPAPTPPPTPAPTLPISTTPPPPLVSSSDIYSSILRTPSPKPKMSIEDAMRNGYKPLLSPITPVTPVSQIRYEPISSPDTTPEVNKYQSPFPFPPPFKKELAKQISADSGFSGTPTDCKLSPVTPVISLRKCFDSIDSPKTEIITQIENGDRDSEINVINVNSNINIHVGHVTLTPRTTKLESDVSTSTECVDMPTVDSEPSVLDSKIIAPNEGDVQLDQVDQTVEKKVNVVSSLSDPRTSLLRARNLSAGLHGSASEPDLQKSLQSNVSVKRSDSTVDIEQDRRQVAVIPQNGSPRRERAALVQPKGADLLTRTKMYPQRMDRFSNARLRRNSGPADSRTGFGMWPTLHNPFAEDHVKYSESGLYTSFTSPNKLLIPTRVRHPSTGEYSKIPSNSSFSVAESSVISSSTNIVSKPTQNVEPSDSRNCAECEDVSKNVVDVDDTSVMSTSSLISSSSSSSVTCSPVVTFSSSSVTSSPITNSPSSSSPVIGSRNVNTSSVMSMPIAVVSCSPDTVIPSEIQVDSSQSLSALEVIPEPVIQPDSGNAIVNDVLPDSVHFVAASDVMPSSVGIINSPVRSVSLMCAASSSPTTSVSSSTSSDSVLSSALVVSSMTGSPPERPAITSTPPATPPVKRKVSLLEYRKRRKERSSTISTSSSTSNKSSDDTPTQSQPKPIPSLVTLPKFVGLTDDAASKMPPASILVNKIPVHSSSGMKYEMKEEQEELWKSPISERLKEDPLDKLRRDLDDRNKERERRDSGGGRSKEDIIGRSPIKRPGSPLPPPPPPSKIKRMMNHGLKLQMPPPPPPKHGPERVHSDVKVVSVSPNHKQNVVRGAVLTQQPPPPPPQQVHPQQQVQQQQQAVTQQQFTPPYQQVQTTQQQRQQTQLQSYQYQQQYPQYQQQSSQQAQAQPQTQPQYQQQYNYNGYGHGYVEQKYQQQPQQQQQTQHYQQQVQQYTQPAAANATYQQQYPQQQQQQQQQQPTVQQTQQQQTAYQQQPYQSYVQQPQQQQQAQPQQQSYSGYTQNNGYYNQQ